MFKVEIQKNNKTISQLYQNSLTEDWARYILTNHKVTKDKVKIYWVKGLDKKTYKQDEVDLSVNGKLSKGKKLKFRLTGSRLDKKSYEDFVDLLGDKNLLDKQEFKSNKKVKTNAKNAETYDIQDLSIFNKDHFIKESEYELVELRWPYDERNIFIGFNFDPAA